MDYENVSTKISRTQHGIVRDEYVILPASEMAKRETIGKRLKTAREGLGLTVPQVREKIFQDYRFEIGESTLRELERDKPPNPGYKTVEFAALGVGLDPLQVIALGLEDPPELDAGYSETQIAQIARVYKDVRKDKKPFADELIKMLIEKLESWR